MQAFTPIVTMLALFVAGLESPTPRLISAVVLIAVGTAIASYGEINLSIIGVIFMFMSESFESTRLVMTQILLVGLKFHPSGSFCVWKNEYRQVLRVVFDPIIASTLLALAVFLGRPCCNIPAPHSRRHGRSDAA